MNYYTLSGMLLAAIGFCVLYFDWLDKDDQLSFVLVIAGICSILSVLSFVTFCREITTVNRYTPSVIVGLIWCLAVVFFTVIIVMKNVI